MTLDALGGVRLLTNGVTTPATWTSQSDFTAPQAPLGPVVDLSTLDAASTGGSLKLPSSAWALRRAQAGPVLSAAAAVSSDGYGVGGMCVCRIGSTYYLWYTGIAENSFTKTIYLATSSDGIAWARQPGPVVTLGPAGSFDSRQVGRPSVVYDPTNTAAPFRMWYSAEGDQGGSIGYATSSNRTTWAKVGQVFGPGTLGGPDSFAVSDPSVLIENGVYRMWYTANDSNNRRIAYATSTDGLTWHRGGIVFDIGTGNYSRGAWSPTVWKSGTTYRMIFTGAKDVSGGGIQTKLINASSSDGTAWTPGNIALNPGNGTDFDGFNMSQPCVLPDPADSGNPFKMWYVGNNPDANGNYHDRVGLAEGNDGSHWAKYSSGAAGTPGSSGTPYYISVFTLGAQSSAFDSMKVADLRLVPAPGMAGTWYGFYTGTNAADFQPRIGVKVTTDRRGYADVLSPSTALIATGTGGQFDAGGVATPAAVFYGGQWIIYHTSLSASGTAAIGLHYVPSGFGTGLASQRQCWRAAAVLRQTDAPIRSRWPQALR